MALNENPSSQAKNFANQLNCPTEKSTEMIECLRKVDVYTLLEVHREALNPQRTMDKIFVPTVESVVDEETFLSHHPLYLMKAGLQAQIPWLTAANADDGLIFAHSNFKMERIRNSLNFEAYYLIGIEKERDLKDIYRNSTYRHLIESDWNTLADSLLFLNPLEKRLSQQIKQFYFGNESDIRLDLVRSFPILKNLVTDRQFMTGLYQSVMIQAHYSPIYLYYYNKVGPSLYNFILLLKGKYAPLFDNMRANVLFQLSRVLGQVPYSFGVCHADELIMLFKIPGFYDIPLTNVNYNFSKDYIRFITSFASNANIAHYPFRNVDVLRVITNSSKELKCLEINDEPRVITLPNLKRLKFWESLQRDINSFSLIIVQ